MSSHCHHTCSRRKKIFYRVLVGTLIFLFIIGLVVLITWAILQPKKPQFILQDASLYAFNITTTPPLLTTNIQITISSRNPNNRIGIYYDELRVFATYRSQPITYSTTIPSTYQDHEEVNLWSPFVYGTEVPVAPYYGLALSQDQANGAIWMMIKINGRVRWKVGSITTGSYHIHVTCPAYIPFGNSNAGVLTVGGVVKYQLSTNCAVSV